MILIFAQKYINKPFVQRIAENLNNKTWVN